MNPAAATVEIACDESGAEGEHLAGGNTDVFAHASVRLSEASATETILEVRDRIRSPATEYKANHLLRKKHRGVLEWLLGPGGPLHGVAHVHLIDKKYFVIGRVTDLFVGSAIAAASLGLDDDPRATAMARTLAREGPTACGAEPWQEFLEAANLLLSAKHRWNSDLNLEFFFDTVERLAADVAPGPIRTIMTRLSSAREVADSLLTRQIDDPAIIWTLDPLLPAIVHTITYWSSGGRSVAIVHDEQSALTEGRIAVIRGILRTPALPRTPGSSRTPEPDGSAPEPRGRLESLDLVDSRWDSRVQLADFLAGTARKIASDELDGHGDPVLTGLLRPYVDEHSLWVDARSWSALGPGVGPGVGSARASS